jgi:DNA-binding CsgD family transcriptional regulator
VTSTNEAQEFANALTTARLQVVQPGSRTSFRRRAMDALALLVPSPGAFFCFGKDDGRAYADSSRIVDGAHHALVNTAATKLTQAFGFQTKSVVETNRRVYRAEELYPDAERNRLPYFRDHSVASKLTRALIVFLHEGGVLFGVCGLERRADDRGFSSEDAGRLEELAAFVVAGARAQMAYDELTKEAAALRALAKVQGSLFVVDREKKKVLWAANREHGIDWAQDVEPIHDQVVEAAESQLAARARGEALPTPPRLAEGTVVGVAKIDGDPVFGAGKCAVVRVETTEKTNAAALDGLSRREREIARLLVAGYSGVNVAAIAGLSENTVRTYVRRLYTKLAVSNRADLVRKLVAPEPRSSAPSSQIAPPPDSSLVDGDDTLD